MDIDLTRQQDRIKFLVPQGSKYIVSPLRLSNHETGASAVVNAVWDTGATRSAVSPNMADYLNLENVVVASPLALAEEWKSGLRLPSRKC